jgi:hypothetical protein
MHVPWKMREALHNTQTCAYVSRDVNPDKAPADTGLPYAITTPVLSESVVSFRTIGLGASSLSFYSFHYQAESRFKKRKKRKKETHCNLRHAEVSSILD